jgi:hypothetical protein
MATETFEFSNGERYELDLANPEHRAWMESYAAKLNAEKPSLLEKAGGALKRGAVSAISGFGRAAADVPRAAALMTPGLSDEGAQKVYQYGDQVEEYWKKFGEDGVKSPVGKRAAETAGALFTAPVAATQGMLRQGLSAKQAVPELVKGVAALGAVGGAAGAGAQLAAPMGPIAEVAAGALTGGLTGFALGPKQTVAQADIRRELEGTSAADWAEAGRNIDLFQTAGPGGGAIPSATMAEAFPGNTRIAALANKTANTRGGEALAEAVKRRGEELGQLGPEFLRRIDENPVDIPWLANRLEDSATGAMENVEGLRSAAFGGRLDKRVLAPQMVESIETELRNKAKASQRKSAREAYELVLEQLRTPDGQPITSLQELSLAIKELKSNPPGIRAATGTVISKSDVAYAVKAAERALEQRSAAFKDANQDFRDFSRDVINPMNRGPIGAVRNKQPWVEDAAPGSTINRFFADQAPDTVSSAMKTVGDPFLTEGNAIPTEQLARALYQRQLQKGSTNPGEKLRGLPGSDSEKQMISILQAAGRNPEQTMQPLQAADLLQGFTQPRGDKHFPAMRSEQFFIRPFRTLDMALTGRLEERTARDTAQLLGGPPTRERLAELLAIAQFDPNLRALLVARGIIPQGEAVEEK